MKALPAESPIYWRIYSRVFTPKRLISERSIPPTSTVMQRSKRCWMVPVDLFARTGTARQRPKHAYRKRRRPPSVAFPWRATMKKASVFVPESLLKKEWYLHGPIDFGALIFTIFGKRTAFDG